MLEIRRGPHSGFLSTVLHLNNPRTISLEIKKQRQKKKSQMLPQVSLKESEAAENILSLMSKFLKKYKKGLDTKSAKVFDRQQVYTLDKFPFMSHMRTAYPILTSYLSEKIYVK